MTDSAHRPALDVRWIPELPRNWKLLPNREIFHEVVDRNHPNEEMLSVTINAGVVKQSALISGTSKKDSSNEDKSAYKRVMPGDIAYNKMRAWQGAIGRSEFHGIVSPAYIVMRFREEQDANYFHYLYRTPAFATEAERWSYGIVSDQWSLRSRDFLQIYSPLPPLEEQRRISTCLQRADQLFNRLIWNKNRLIALLNEEKQAIIQHAVTLGLDPSMMMKPSTVDWLGDIPAHWASGSLRRFWEIVDCKHLTVPFVDEGIPLASVSEVRGFELDLSSAKKTTREWYEVLVSNGRKPAAGDLIYCRNVSVGSCAFVGDEEMFAMGQDVCLIRSAMQNQRFLNYLLHSPFMAEQLNRLLIGSTFKRINIGQILNLQVLVPPRVEQDQISDFLDRECSSVDEAIKRIVQEIALVREYRMSLIFNVVTGQLDAREVRLEEIDLEGIEPSLEGMDLNEFDRNEDLDEFLDLDE